VVSVNIVTSRDLRVTISEHHPSIVERQNVLVSVFVFVLRLLSLFSGLAAGINLRKRGYRDGGTEI
jgi:hypothetical protein